jgi:hypothetical protein
MLLLANLGKVEIFGNERSIQSQLYQIIGLWEVPVPCMIGQTNKHQKGTTKHAGESFLVSPF